MHSTASRFSRECSSTFGTLKHFSVGLKSNYCGIAPVYRAIPTSQCQAHRFVAIIMRTNARIKYMAYLMSTESKGVVNRCPTHCPNGYQRTAQVGGK